MTAPIPIVVTSINSANKCIDALSSRSDHQLIYVADLKSPKNLESDCYNFSIEAQANSQFKLADVIPYNSYARKNLGYLYVFSYFDTQYLLETDDDNFPLANFFAPRERFLKCISASDSQWVNVYSHFSDAWIWPRGFPLDEIRRNFDLHLAGVEVLDCPIQQELANGDTDTDAIFRLTHPHIEMNFKSKTGLPLAMGEGSYCPFNSQSTVWFQIAWPMMYLPFTCNFRLTDIWRGYIAQKWLQNCGYSLAFNEPTVFQDRNAHNFLMDFENEVPGYLRVKDFVDVLSSVQYTSYKEFLLKAYSDLVNAGFFLPDEMIGLKAWLSDLDDMNVKDREVF